MMSTGKVDIINEDKPNPIRLLKEYRNLHNAHKRCGKQKKGSWIDELHDDIKASLTKQGMARPSIVGKWEALVRMMALSSMDSDGFCDLEAANCIDILMVESGVSTQVPRLVCAPCQSSLMVS